MEREGFNRKEEQPTTFFCAVQHRGGRRSTCLWLQSGPKLRARDPVVCEAFTSGSWLERCSVKPGIVEDVLSKVSGIASKRF